MVGHATSRECGEGGNHLLQRQGRLNARRMDVSSRPCLVHNVTSSMTLELACSALSTSVAKVTCCQHARNTGRSRDEAQEACACVLWLADLLRVFSPWVARFLVTTCHGRASPSELLRKRVPHSRHTLNGSSLLPPQPRSSQLLGARNNHMRLSYRRKCEE